MNCLDGLIGDDNGCVSRAGRLYLRDIGITEDFIGKILSKEDQNAAAFMAARRRLATEYVTNDVLTHYDKYILGRTFIDRDRLGRYPDNEVLVNGDANYLQGTLVEVCTPASNTRLLISKLEFYGETTGDVVVTVYDLRDGSTVATETITAVAGQVATLETDIVVQCFREKKRLLIVTDQDTYYRSTISGSGCASCSGGWYRNGVMQARSSRILAADKKIGANVLPAQDCGGLSVVATVQCDSYGWLCEVKPALALPLLYCYGREIMTMALNNFERYNIQNLRRKDVEDRRDELEALYAKSMNNLYETMPIPNDGLCFSCDNRTYTTTVLP